MNNRYPFLTSVTHTYAEPYFVIRVPPTYNMIYGKQKKNNNNTNNTTRQQKIIYYTLFSKCSQTIFCNTIIKGLFPLFSHIRTVNDDYYLYIDHDSWPTKIITIEENRFISYIFYILCMCWIHF